jgi:hypothetical protein
VLLRKARRKKEEKSLLEKLIEKYQIPPDVKVSEFPADEVSVEKIFADIVNYIAPFSEILREIYLFLNHHRSTILGKADQFALRFEEIAERVPFGLDSFPKTYIDMIRTGVIEVISFDPLSEGILFVDTPDCWSRTNALSNLGYHRLVDSLIFLFQNAYGHHDAERFIDEHKAIIEEAVEKTRTILRCCQVSLIYDQTEVR